MSIRRTLYLTIIAMTMLPFLLFSAVALQLYNARVERLIADSLQAVANAQVAEMTNFCEQQMRSLITLGSSDVFRTALRGELDDGTLEYVNGMLASHVNSAEYLESCMLIDPNGKIVAYSEDVPDTKANKGFDTLAQRARGEGFFISDVLTYSDAGEERQAVIALACIKDGDEAAGYMLAEINLDFYSAIREKSLLWENSTFYLLDSQGKIISAGTSEDGLASFVTTEAERRDYVAQYNAIDFEANPKGSFSYTVGGKAYISYYSNVAYTGWRMLLSISPDDYTADESVSILLACFVVLLFIVLTVWIARFTSKRLMQPIDRISEMLNKIREKQDYSPRLRVEKQDELGVLSGEINELIDFIETENLDVARRQRDLQERAEQDPLTGVMNKGRIMEHLEEAVVRCARERRGLAVFFVDVDDFKAFNTLYGHGVGDQVLQFFAKTLVGQTRGAVGRLGGDEFLVVLEGLDALEQLETCLIRVQRHMRSDFVLRGGEQLPIYCCIGAATVDFAAPDAPSVTADALLDCADAQMYAVKNRGKHGFHIAQYHP